MLAHLVERLRRSRNSSPIVITTSYLEDDRPLVDLASDLGIESFQGDPDDVLARIGAAAEHFDLETVISCTADNPFVDPVWADALMDLHIGSNADFGRIEGLPWGTFSYSLDRSAIARACKMKATSDTEVWGGYFTEDLGFKTVVLSADDPAVNRPEYRLTVDTPADFALVEGIFEALGDRVFPLEDIVALLDDRPDLLKINAAVEQAVAKPIVLRSDLDNGPTAFA